MGDEREFADFVTARMPALLRWAHLLTGDRGRAEDLAQHAFAATYRHWRRITPGDAEAYGAVPSPDRMPPARGDVRLTAALWDGSVRPPLSDDYAGGKVLGTMLDPGWSQPVGVAVLEDLGSVGLRSGRPAEPRFYEVHRNGRTYLGWIVTLDALPTGTGLVRLEDDGGLPRPDIRLPTYAP